MADQPSHGQAKARIPYNIKMATIARDGQKCSKCRATRWLEVHHIVPLYRGGTNDKENLITLCSLCHYHAPEHPIDFFRFMSEPNRPPVDLAMEVAEHTFVAAMRLEKEECEIAKSDPKQFWRSRYRTSMQRALSWLYEHE